MSVIDNSVSVNIKPKREVKSYVCRNRKLSPANQILVDDYYPQYGLSAEREWNFAEIFNNNNKVIIEIGFGTGDTLVQNAIDNPDYNYIGIEVYQSGCVNVLANIKQHSIKNLRVYNGDAKLILESKIKPGSVFGLQLFFPDPWPKKKHHKRRIVQPAFIEQLSTLLQGSGFIHMATDWLPYAEHMQDVLENHCKFSKIDYSNNRLLTRFEQKGLNKGHIITDLFYEKVADGV